MKTIIKILSFTFFLFISTQLLAQTPPPPPADDPGANGGTVVGGGAPIGGGVFLLSLLGLFYSGRKYFYNQDSKII